MPLEQSSESNLLRKSARRAPSKNPIQGYESKRQVSNHPKKSKFLKRKAIVRSKEKLGCDNKKPFEIPESQIVYCLCRKPDDGIRSMIECDICHDWFHFDCANINPVIKIKK